MKGQKRKFAKSNQAFDNDTKLTRRDFMGMAAATTAFTIVPRHVFGGSDNNPPSEKLNIAGIGVGGRGAGDLDADVGSHPGGS